MNKKLSRNKRTQRGDTTSNLTLSAFVGNNEDLFPKILQLHVPFKSIIADVTFGKGIFWKKVNKDSYAVKASDIKTGIDCRNLPYKDESIDCVVFDPPYMEGLFRRSTNHLAGAGSHKAFRETYSNGSEHTVDGPKYHNAVLDLYFKGGKEALRILRKEGIFIVKCQDEVSANEQHLTHVEIINHYKDLGYYCKDLFVLIRNGKPSVSRMIKQVHARKSHSYFLVFIKTTKKRSSSLS